MNINFIANKKTLKTGLVYVFLACNLIGIIVLQMKTILDLRKDTSIETIKEENTYLKNYLNMINKAPSLGFSNIISDWVYLNFVQYFGDNIAREQIGYSLSPIFFQAIINHDPNFINAYLLLDPATTLFAGEPTISVKVMTEGLKTLTPKIENSYLVWIYKAVDELLFLGEPGQAQESYKSASEWALSQNDETSLAIGRRAQEASQFLKKNPDSKQVQASAWLMVLSNAKDQKTLRLALDKIQELGGSVTTQGNKVIVSFPSIN